MKKVYSWDEIEKHNKNDDIWIVANNNVYDVSELVNVHPGGKNAILRHAVQDCTLDYNFHSKNGKKQWDKYKIGKLQTDKKNCFCNIM